MKWQGKGVSEGLAMAQVHLFTPKLPEISRQPAGDPEAEVQKFEQTLAAAQDELHALYESAKEKMGEKEAEIFDAHLTILGDEYSVHEPIVQRIREQKQNAAAAIADQFDEMAQMFRSLGDELMAERAADAEDLKQQLLRICLGCGRQDLSNLPGDVIVLAEELTPSDTVRMDTAHVKGIATKLGGATAHSAIIARTLGIPAAAGIDGWQTMALDGHMAILDGADGSLIVDPSEAEMDCYRCRKSEADCQAQALEEFRSRPSQTKDGAALEICANIGTPQEAQQAMEYGADGVGLFRSEFLYLEKETFPTEEEQFQVYKQVAETMAGKPVIIRTLDIGADKQCDYFELKKEENPAMGCRAIRICLTRPEIFKTQLRALFRASAYGNLQIMYPMITSVWEVEAIAKIVEEVKTELTAQNLQFGDPKQGIMIETPAAVMVSRELAKKVDFFSIGTNDLTQYTLAVDRQNPELDAFYDPHHPAVLAMIRMVVENAHVEGIWAGICGELGADLSLTKEFLKMGVDELSVSPGRVLPIRKVIVESSCS